MSAPDRHSSHDQLPAAACAALEALAREHDDLAARLSDPAVAGDYKAARDLAIRKGALEPAASAWRELLDAEREAADLRALIDAASSARDDDSRELGAIAAADLEQAQARIANASARALETLVRSDEAPVGSVVLELRAGVGGDEAALWTADLLAMYQRFAQRRGWSFEPLDVQAAADGASVSSGSSGATSGGGGGVRSAVIAVTGEGAWDALAHESGTHSVKRVPATETQGRVHTSTATVAVLPEPKDVELNIDAADVEEHVTTAQGPGGQNVNKVATAVHLRHTPTGVEVRMQESKSQRQNREKAWRLLRARLYELERARAAAERNAARAAQIGDAARAERIRTYRYKEGVVADHRLERQFPLRDALSGDLDELTTALHRREIERRIANMAL